MGKQLFGEDDMDLLADDDLSASLRENLKHSEGDDTGDSGGFDAPLDDKSVARRDLITEEDGVRRIQDGKNADVRTSKDEVTGAGASAGAETNAAGTDAGKARDDATAGAGAQVTTESLDDEAYAAELEKLPAALKGRIAADRAQLTEISGIFRGREAQMQGQTPIQATKFLADVWDYAAREPGQYAAWALGELAGGDPAKVEGFLKQAAEAHGFTIGKAAADAGGEDDPFISDREKELLQENRRLKEAQQPGAPQFGPNNPSEQFRRMVIDVAGEVDGKGQPLRPHFGDLTPALTTMIQAHRQANGGAAISREDLVSLYERAELVDPRTKDAAIERLAASKTAAAQGQSDMQKEAQRRAAALDKAKQASNKLMDSSGQGAERQPASEDDDIPLADFIRMQLRKSKG